MEENGERVAHYDILTNGTLINDDDIVRLKKYTKLRRIQVSWKDPHRNPYGCSQR